uniref:PPPDE domain-containing protein n=1 Tax=Arcella intermedia TaxID=1963864 RepID=A0A6B2L6K4_9EUKA
MNLYDLVSDQMDITKWNNITLSFGFGAFHTAISAFGSEVSFGYPKGIYKCRPKRAKGYLFRKSIPLGEIDITSDQFKSLLQDMKPDYIGTEYHILEKNCNHFTRDLCKRLFDSVVQYPSYVNKLAKFATFMTMASPTKRLVDSFTRMPTPPPSPARPAGLSIAKDIPLNFESPKEDPKPLPLPFTARREPSRRKSRMRKSLSTSSHRINWKPPKSDGWISEEGVYLDAQQVVMVSPRGLSEQLSSPMPSRPPPPLPVRESLDGPKLHKTVSLYQFLMEKDLADVAERFKEQTSEGDPVPPQKLRNCLSRKHAVSSPLCREEERKMSLVVNLEEAEEMEMEMEKERQEQEDLFSSAPELRGLLYVPQEPPSRREIERTLTRLLLVNNC